MSGASRSPAMLLLACALAAALPCGAAGPPPLLASEPDAPAPADPAVVDAAIARALDYLAEQQEADGSFRSQLRGNTGVTSLCVMAFLAGGHTPGTGRYGEAISRGVDFVLGSMTADDMLVGKGGHRMYSHCISTLMLSEVNGMLDPERQGRLDDVLPRALKSILDAQRVKKGERHRGGWRYEKTSNDSDLSCTGWPILALRAARNSGAPVPEQAIADALDYVMRCRNKDGGFAYQPGQGSGLARAGVALLCFELAGRHGEASSEETGEWILRNLRQKESHWHYGTYYCAQATYQLGGKYWAAYSEHMHRTLLPQQQADGSFPPSSAGGGKAGPAYSTAMCALALSVPCCQMPIYQR